MKYTGNKIKQICLLLFIGVLSGCVSVTEDITPGYSLDSAAKENKGLLIVSTRFSLICDSVDPLGLGVGTPGGLWGNVWPNGNDTSGIWAYHPARRKSDFRSPYGYFHVQKLAPGEYYFNYMRADQDHQSSITREIASLPFTIEKGRATYVGEVSVAISECDYSAEPEAVANMKFTVSNQWRRDKHEFKARFHNIDPSKVKLMITHI